MRAAEGKISAEPPTEPGGAPATAARTWLASLPKPVGWPAAVCAVWWLGLVTIHGSPWIARHEDLWMGLALGSGAVTSLVMMALGRDARGRLELCDGRILLGGRAFALTGVETEILAWKSPYLWTPLGAALRLRTADGVLCIGARGHLLPYRAERPFIHTVDASLASSAFVELVQALGSRSPVPEVGRADVLEVELVPSPMRRMWLGMGTWMGAMAATAAVGVLGSLLHLLERPAGRFAIEAVAIAVCLAGLFSSIRSSRRPPNVRYRLRIDAGGRVTLVDAKTTTSEQLVGAIDPVTYRYRSKGTSIQIPALRLRWPSGKMVVGVWDTSQQWPRSTARCMRLDYVVGPEEWKRLVRTTRANTRL